MKTIYLYFDFISPYVYLAWFGIKPILKKYDVVLNPIPVLFAGLLNAHGQKGPAEIPSKRIYTVIDTMRGAIKLNIPYEGPPAHPFNPLSPLRMTLAMADSVQKNNFIEIVLNACWAEGRDISDANVLKDLCLKAGCDVNNAIQKMQNIEVKEELKKNTETAIARGVFGVPTFMVDNELFWGSDRIQFMENYLNGQLKVDQTKVEKILKRPRAADRK